MHTSEISAQPWYRSTNPPAGEITPPGALPGRGDGTHDARRTHGSALNERIASTFRRTAAIAAAARVRLTREGHRVTRRP